ncbi:MAG: hypothetical protein LBK26_01085 [Rickettsiales bacterium]|jgi:hypothetical protein|nr:hypothetical protein [Rickettsiales bacterium]
MMKITKSTGFTESEHRLARLAEKVFMGLWSYPNPKWNTTPGPKELCDLLVVCGNNVLIFSDKNIKFNPNIDLATAWSRWERNAILNSIKQLRHAENIIRDNPQKILLNDTDKFPITIPDKDKIKIHLICVANGIKEACIKNRGDSCNGSLGFSNARNPKLFETHDYDKNKTFVHVFDDYTFPFILNELDTLTDFIRYLDEKEHLIRSKYITYAGEEDLLCYYATYFDRRKNKHTFPGLYGTKATDIVFPKSDWDFVHKTDGYKNKKQANRVSYFWDQFVQNNSTCTLDGITIRLSPRDCDHDMALRYLAMEDRLNRRMLSRYMLDAIKNSPDIITPDTLSAKAFVSMATPDLLYMLIQAPNHDNRPYEEYHNYRRQLVETFAHCAKAQSVSNGRPINKVIGIATDPVKHNGGNTTDIVFFEYKQWSDEIQTHWDNVRREMKVFESDILAVPLGYEPEFPDPKHKGIQFKIGPNDLCPCRSGK